MSDTNKGNIDLEKLEEEAKRLGTYIGHALQDANVHGNGQEEGPTDGGMPFREDYNGGVDAQGRMPRDTTTRQGEEDAAMLNNNNSGGDPMGAMSSLRPEDVHVLVVDDERMSRTVVSTLLKKCKYRVTTAEDGAEAVELLRSHAPGTFQLILTDVCMPQMNGIELLQYVRSEDALRLVPVVMMSSIDNGETVYECVERGAEEYLVKPVTQKEVQHIWQHILKKRCAVTTVPQAQSTDSLFKNEVTPQVQQQQQQHQIDQQQRKMMSRSTSIASGVGSPNVQEKPCDLAAAGDFLKLMRDARMDEIVKLREQLQALEHDEEFLSRDTRTQDSESVSRKRCRDEIGMQFHSTKGNALDELYFSARKHRSSQTGEGCLEQFADDLHVLAQGHHMSVKALIRCGTMASPQEMVCCSDFDADDDHFATVSVSRSVKVFDFENITSNPEALQFPVWQVTTRSKLSSVSWNAYIRSHLITSDYDGLIQLWDVSTGSKLEVSQFEEHSKRVWSVDFSRLDPMSFASASDDSTVRLWNLNQEAPTACINTPANACSVQYSPHNAMLVSVACANHNAFLFDIRRTDYPLAVLTDCQRAVSYTRFMDRDTILCASTDNSIRSWDIRSVTENGKLKEVPTMAAETLHHVSKYTGHVNERNFVGLSVHPDGYIATGSEDNTVYCYYRAFPFAISRHQLNSGRDEEETLDREKSRESPRTFVSSVCWSRNSKDLLVGNSEGVLKVLRLN